jgi:ABC-type multidrug transport system ATPase subunit
MINEVLDVMTDLAREGMTMMVVTHEMGFARRVAHRVVFMDGGQIVEVQAPQAFFRGAPVRSAQGVPLEDSLPLGPLQQTGSRGEKGSAARRRPRAGREAYFLYVERSAEGGNEADEPLSPREHTRRSA